MVTLRWANGTALADRKLRWANAVASGAGTAPKARWADAVLKGTAPLVLRPIPDRTAEALDVVTLTAQVGATSPTPTGYVWRQVSGPDTTFSDNGSTITFTAPPSVAGIDVVFGVTALLGEQTSPEATGTVDVLPHLYWLAGTDDWVPLTKTKLA